MSDYKNDKSSPAQKETSALNGTTREAYEATLRSGRMRNVLSPDGRESGGWDAYRRWLSRVQTNDKRRSPVDPALYTWKGYRNWSDKVRRDWKGEEK